MSNYSFLNVVTNTKQISALVLLFVHYRVSTVSMPSKCNASFSWSAVIAQSAVRERRTSSAEAFTTGQRS